MIITMKISLKNLLFASQIKINVCFNNFQNENKVLESLIFQSEEVSTPLQKLRQWWKKYLMISLRFKKFQLAQCWDRHAFLPQVPTSATFSTLKVGGGGFFSKYFFQGCSYSHYLAKYEVFQDIFANEKPIKVTPNSWHQS